MKKLIWVTFALLPLFYVATAQKERALKKTIELKIPEKGGANAANVAWHPVLKKYYAAMAGNADHPFAVFDATGKAIPKPGLKTLVDVRGLWYNPRAKALQANAYSDGGLVQYQLDPKGFPVSFKQLDVDTEKPDLQCTAAFNPLAQVIYFYYEGEVTTYSLDDGAPLESTELHLSYASEKEEEDGLDLNDDLFENYNSVTMIYTGIKGAEWGLLNKEENQIELYNQATGYLSQKLKLPENAPKFEWFNFSFTNGTYWLFDTIERKWIGYK